MLLSLCLSLYLSLCLSLCLSLSLCLCPTLFMCMYLILSLRLSLFLSLTLGLNLCRTCAYHVTTDGVSSLRGASACRRSHVTQKGKRSGRKGKNEISQSSKFLGA